MAALTVMAFHYWYRDWVPRTTFTGHIVARGYISVDLFFILSGFVMAKAYGPRFMGTFDRSSYMRFIERRLARIYPIYVLLVLLGVIGSLLKPYFFPPLTWHSVILNVTLTQAWFRHLSTVGSAWSLSTEWAAYLTFPALVWLVLRSRAAVALAACAGAVGLILLVWGYNVSIGESPPLALDEAGGLLAPFGRCFGGFIIGMGVFRFMHSPALAPVGTDRFGAWLALLFLVLWVLPGTPDLLLYACLPFIILCLALNSGWFAAFFGSKPVWLLGEWSYSIYLVHIFVIHGRLKTFVHLTPYMPPPLADVLSALVFYGLTITASAACFSLVEVPARRYLVARIARSVHRASPSVAAPPQPFRPASSAAQHDGPAGLVEGVGFEPT